VSWMTERGDREKAHVLAKLLALMIDDSRVYRYPFAFL
jgi:hypothetical protein